jgi:hypothetical protein
MTTRIIRDYNTAKALGEIEMSDKKYAQYVADADRDTGAIKAGDLCYGHIEWSDVPSDDTTVYIEE